MAFFPKATFLLCLILLAPLFGSATSISKAYAVDVYSSLVYSDAVNWTETYIAQGGGPGPLRVVSTTTVTGTLQFNITLGGTRDSNDNIQGQATGTGTYSGTYTLDKTYFGSACPASGSFSGTFTNALMAQTKVQSGVVDFGWPPTGWQMKLSGSNIPCYVHGYDAAGIIGNFLGACFSSSRYSADAPVNGCYEFPIQGGAHDLSSTTKPYSGVDTDTITGTSQVTLVSSQKVLQVPCGLAVGQNAQKAQDTPVSPSQLPEASIAGAITGPMSTTEAKQKLTCLNCATAPSHARLLSILPAKEANVNGITFDPGVNRVIDSTLYFNTADKHHMMQDALVSKLQRLSDAVQNEWKNQTVSLNINAAYDFEGIHSIPTSLHYEGRAVDLSVLVNGVKDYTKLPRLAGLAYESGFNWVYTEPAGTTNCLASPAHVHASVASDVHTTSGPLTLTSVPAGVFIIRSGSTDRVAAHKGDVIKSGDKIVTGSSPDTLLEWPGVKLHLGRNTEFTVNPSGAGDISTGQLYTQAACNNVPYCFTLTSHGVAIWVSGTEFMVTAETNSTSISVMKGTIQAAVIDRTQGASADVTDVNTSTTTPVGVSQSLKLSGPLTGLTAPSLTGAVGAFDSASVATWWERLLAFPLTVDGKQFVVGGRTNSSSVSNFNFNQQGKSMSFVVNGASGTKGYVNMTWPTTLLNGTFTVMMDGKQIPFSLKQIGANYSLYSSYSHSQHTIVITGTTAVPEFPSIGNLGSSMLTWMIVLALTGVLISKGLSRLRQTPKV